MINRSLASETRYKMNGCSMSRCTRPPEGNDVYIMLGGPLCNDDDLRH